MAGTIGQILPLALGIGLIPIPVIAIILMLLTPRSRANGASFLIGWVGGLLLVGSIAIAVANRTSVYGDEDSSTVNWITIAVGVVLIGLGIRKWLGRPRSGEAGALPKWMSAVTSFTPARAFGLGATLSAANPKNIALTIAAAATIAESGLPIGREALALVAFVVVATAGVATPFVVVLAKGTRATTTLEGWRSWLERHNAALMAGVLLVIGLALVAGSI